ncbi:MAG TPA: response regulator, partial [Gemmatimonadales bacterium]|nr:response regulator [Gemmatimonadales bacterium]
PLMDPISILVVDDTRQNLVTLEAILEEPGLRVVGVGSAREALRRLLQEEFAAILLDVHMPDMDGFETASLIRQRPLSKHTPILFLTAYAVEAQLSKAYALGAVDYMPTPVQPDVLKAKVGVFADLYRKRMEVRRQAEMLRDAEARLRQQAEHALRESEGRFQVLCTAAPIAIFQLDTEGRCVYASPVWEATTGRPPEVAAGTGWADAVSDGRGAETMASWHETVSRGEPWSCESRFTSRDAPRWVHVRTSAILGDAGETTGHVGTVEDITTRKLTEARLLEADRRKDEFLAMLAHELRNPLAAISSAVTVARTPHLERERDWSVAVIGRQVRHLEKLIDDLMDVSRITLGKIDMRRERLDLSLVLTRALDGVRAMVSDRRQRLEADLPRQPLWAEVDPTRLEQVFVNLLTNASKYSHDGGRIWFGAVAGPGGVEVHVRDEGIGLDPLMAERVFDLFAQAQTGLDRSKGGLGIGLSLAQRLTELHGGRIRVHSDGLGRGAEFVVSLPLAAAEPDAPAADETAPAQATPAPARTVLLVDDNIDATRALALLLSHAGYGVVTAHDGAEALTRAAEARPDIVLLDLGLPIMDGYRVAEVLRAGTDAPDALLVAISGYGQPEDRERSRDVGFDHHLVKPIDCAALLDLLRNDVPATRLRRGPGAVSAG